MSGLHFPQTFRRFRLSAVSRISISICLAAAALGSTAAAQVDGDRLSGSIKRGTFSSSQIFPGTTRDYWVYIPKQYAASNPASLMVFMDGRNYAKADGAFAAPTVMQELIDAGQMPVTIGVFVNPGTIKAKLDGGKNRSNRSYEYDSLSDRYVRFLTDEFLPIALKGINVSDDPSDRAVVGISSGGICAFTAAWQAPDQFGKVLSHIGSYTNIRGGWAYPGLIRKTQESPKPIKVYLQEGRDDLSNLHGNWPLGNRDMAAALQFAGYHYKLEMTDGGHSGKWAGQVFADALKWLWDEQSEPTVMPNPATKPKWEPHPDALDKANVPKGKVIEMPPLEDSTIFPGTTRKWAVYVPAQYSADQPAALMVVQDGERLRKLDGRWRIPTVFDNLIAAGQMPTTIAVFIDPGHELSKVRRGNKSSNRSLEYDSLGSRYVNFLLTDVLPRVESKYNITTDPQMRAIGGSSSGAICAFTAAWERPDQFRKVYSNVGSFTNLRGGNIYPAWIRKTEPKPIRVFMSDTSGDVDNRFGSWPIANLRMASALSYMGYDSKLVWEEGYGHNADFGSIQFPDAMRWLWRDEVPTPQIDTSDDLGGDLTLLNLLIPGSEWELVASDLGFTDACCCDGEGNFYFCDIRAPAIYKVAVGRSPEVIAKVAVSGLEFTEDGRLIGCHGRENRLIEIDLNSGNARTITDGVYPNDLAIFGGQALITETRQRRVTRVDLATGEKTIVDSGDLLRPNGIGLSPDGGTLAVSDHGGQQTWLYRFDGRNLDAKMPNMPMRLPIDPAGEFKFNTPPPYKAASKGDGLATDAQGRFYVTSELGIQIFDPTGRPCGVLPPPDPTQPLVSCTIGGPNGNYLLVAN
ncbi:MAG TPA: hydrolase, partial [Planctomycetaceae bacterium]|nr:hydrolase [Planctomycetaceae bacterium]